MFHNGSRTPIGDRPVSLIYGRHIVKYEVTTKGIADVVNNENMRRVYDM